ncbi:hypothetical protein SOPP22_00905 [Shewanella sp. OPT22]|nr:hypothetical protein SOPP22_00905 [Shewanella sp. OPT22]
MSLSASSPLWTPEITPRVDNLGDSEIQVISCKRVNSDTEYLNISQVKFFSKTAIDLVNQTKSYCEARGEDFLEGCDPRAKSFFDRGSSDKGKKIVLTGFSEADLKFGKKNLHPVKIYVASNLYYFRSAIATFFVDHNWHDYHGIHSHIGIGSPGGHELKLKLKNTFPHSEASPHLRKKVFIGKTAKPAPVFTLASDDMRAFITIDEKLIHAVRKLERGVDFEVDKEKVIETLMEIKGETYAILEYCYVAYKNIRMTLFDKDADKEQVEKQIMNEFSLILKARSDEAKLRSCELWHTVFPDTAEGDVSHYQRSEGAKMIVDVDVFSFFNGVRQLSLHQLYLDEKLGRSGIGVSLAGDVSTVNYKESNRDERLSSCSKETIKSLDSFNCRTEHSRVPEAFQKVNPEEEFTHNPIKEKLYTPGVLSDHYESIPRFCMGVDVCKQSEPGANFLARAVHKKLHTMEAFPGLDYDVPPKKRGNCNAGLGSFLRNAYDLKIVDQELSSEVQVRSVDCLEAVIEELPNGKTYLAGQFTPNATIDWKSGIVFDSRSDEVKLAILQKIQSNITERAWMAKIPLAFEFVGETDPNRGDVAHCRVYGIDLPSYNAVGINHNVDFWNPIKKKLSQEEYNIVPDKNNQETVSDTQLDANFKK